MTLLTAHKILIGSAVALFVFYGVYEIRRYMTGDAGAFVRALVSVAGAAGLSIYLRSVFRKNRI